MNPKVSIIVPVYNVSGYLRRCLDSLLCQTLRELEIIAVDDGSTDGCARILDEYAARDERVVVVHQENGGLSAARNAGLLLARGEYIGFVDSDDAARPDMFRAMSEAADSYGCEVVQCGHFNVSDEGTTRKASRKLPAGGPFSAAELFSKMPRAHTRQCLCFCWRFLFSHRLLRENGILFDPELKYCEDAPFNLAAILKANAVYVLEKRLYLYTHRSDSIIRTPFKPELEQHLNRQYLMKLELLAGTEVGGNAAFMDDMYYYNLYTMMKMMVNNIYDGGGNVTRGLKKILGLEMIRDSFRHVPLSRFKDEPVIWLSMLAAKYRCPPLLKFLNDKFLRKVK